MKPLSCDPQKIRGIPEKLIFSRYENNCGGAVKRLKPLLRISGEPIVSLYKQALAAFYVIVGVLIGGVAMAETVNFDQDAAGKLPPGWICGVTGRGNPVWKVEADASAPSKPNVLRQSGEGTFPWCVKSGTAVTDGYVEVKFKSIAGREDQAGGVVWRWKDKDNYYVARANALEDNVSLYYTSDGRRNTIKYVDAPVPKATWHILRVEFTGTNIKVYLNGKLYIDVNDKRISGPGAVGVWTKADSNTAFDDFTFGASALK